MVKAGGTSALCAVVVDGSLHGRGAVAPALTCFWMALPKTKVTLPMAHVNTERTFLAFAIDIRRPTAVLHADRFGAPPLVTGATTRISSSVVHASNRTAELSRDPLPFGSAGTAALFPRLRTS